MLSDAFSRSFFFGLQIYYIFPLPDHVTAPENGDHMIFDFVEDLRKNCCQLRKLICAELAWIQVERKAARGLAGTSAGAALRAFPSHLQSSRCIC